MNKKNLTPVFYGPAILCSLFLLSGCASEIRYDENVKTYLSPQSGTKSLSDNDPRTITYSSPQSGVKSLSGKYDDVTAHYISRNKGTSTPQSEVIKAPPEKQVADLPMVIEVTDVLFEFDKWVIKEPFVPELNQWADYFKNNPQVTADIYGHTDSTGPSKYNDQLSAKRAQAVVNFLVESGVASDRLRAKGFGEGQPTETNDTREGRQKNRRVELNF